jgi:Tol biopolymer transport system component
MVNKVFSLSFISVVFLFSFSTDNDILRYPQEIHLKNIRQLTFGGDNAEAYWSFDGSMLCFQRSGKAYGLDCDQIFYGKVNENQFNPQRISTGTGRTTCAFFMPGDSLILFSSTHHANASCPHFQSIPGKYLWPVFNDYEIYVADLKGNIKRRLTNNNYYDAEATVSPRGDKIVFTSNRSGDLELYICDIDGSNVRQITHELGYDGGAFFSPDGNQIVFRASRPLKKSVSAAKEYQELLQKGYVAPSEMEIFVCDIDGKNMRQITQLGKANWAPFFHPSGKKIIFCSNHHAQGSFPFNLFMIDIDGKNLKQITYDDVFDSFPMFSPDGKKLVFCSNRFNNKTRDTNIFVADWVE